MLQNTELHSGEHCNKWNKRFKQNRIEVVLVRLKFRETFTQSIA